MNILKNIPQFFDLFKEGKELANAATWKSRTVATNILVAFLGTLLIILHNSGVDLPLDQETVSNLAAGIVALVAAGNGVMHCLTSKRVGLSSNVFGGSDSGSTGDSGNDTKGSN